MNISYSEEVNANFSIYSDAISDQLRIAKKVISRNILPKKISTVCGVDVAYSNNTAYCSAVIVDKNTLKKVKHVNKILKVKHRYISGLFMLRESEPIFSTLKLLNHKFDILLVDAHGKLHPRKCGLACYVGVNLNKPVIGVAKSLLCGNEQGNDVILDGKIIGNVIKTGNKKIYVSVGHKINQKTAVKIVRELIKDGEWYPLPLKLAHIDSKKLKIE